MSGRLHLELQGTQNTGCLGNGEIHAEDAADFAHLQGDDLHGDRGRVIIDDPGTNRSPGVQAHQLRRALGRRPHGLGMNALAETHARFTR